MSRLMRGAGLLIIAGLTGLAGCGTTQAVSPGAAKSPAPASSTPAPRTTAPSPSPTDKPTVTPGGTSGACSQPGSYLTSVRVGEHDGYDRVVFQFSGGLPAVTANRVPAVYADPRGTPVPLAGQSYLHVVFHGASAVCQQRQAADLDRAIRAHAVLPAAAGGERSRRLRGLPELRHRPSRPGQPSRLYPDRPGPGGNRRQPRRARRISRHLESSPTGRSTGPLSIRGSTATSPGSLTR